MTSFLSTPIRKKQRTTNYCGSTITSATPSLIDLIPAIKQEDDGFTKFGLRQGKIVFPDKAMQQHPGSAAAAWQPPPKNTSTINSSSSGDLIIKLNKYGGAQEENSNESRRTIINNTLAVKFSAPPDAKRFSFNLVSPDHDGFSNILFHFNPRQYDKRGGGKIVLNDKIGEKWGKAINIPLSQFPVMFGRVCTILVQLDSAGFNVLVNDSGHRLHFNRRQKFKPDWDHLILQCPSTDDYGNCEKWEVEKIWWGHHAPVTTSNSSCKVAAAVPDIVDGVKQDDSLHPCKLFIRGLGKIKSDSDVERRRAYLERSFRRYGGAQGFVKTWVPKNRSYAFVETDTKEKADLALKEMANSFCLSRAIR